MIVRFTEVFGLSLPETNTPAVFVDAGNISYWELDAVARIQNSRYHI